jgi:hypothetical protein
MATAAEFLEQNQQNGTISPEKMEKLLAGGFEFEGPGKDPDAKEPEAVKAEEPKVEEAKPVIVAKDGVHTIEYEKLEEARNEAKEAKAKMVELLQQNQEMAGKLKTFEDQLAAAQRTDAAAGTSDATRQLIEDARELEPELVKAFEAMLQSERAQYKAELATLRQQRETELEPIKATARKLAEHDHFVLIRGEVKDFDAIVAGDALNSFVNEQPSFVRNQYTAVLESGTAVEVIELMNAFKKSPHYKPPAGETAGTEPKKIEVKKTPPVSLSEMPAGTQAHGDPADALANSSGIGILSMLEGKTKEEVDRLTDRALRMKV